MTYFQMVSTKEAALDEYSVKQDIYLSLGLHGDCWWAIVNGGYSLRSFQQALKEVWGLC